jgi:hypothetical protein
LLVSRELITQLGTNSTQRNDKKLLCSVLAESGVPPFDIASAAWFVAEQIKSESTSQNDRK